jgi:hypothetical protein
MLDVVMLVRGLGFLLAAVDMRTLANGSEENEYDLRLFARRLCRCRLAVLPAPRSVAA